jgi:hypothetical protein
MSTTIIIIVNIALSVVLAVGLTPLWVWWERRMIKSIQKLIKAYKMQCKILCQNKYKQLVLWP